MDGVSSRVCLDLLSVRRQGRGRDCSASSSNPMMEGPGADSEEKHEPASDIDTAVADSLKALDPKWPIREADIAQYGWHVSNVPRAVILANLIPDQMDLAKPLSSLPL